MNQSLSAISLEEAEIIVNDTQSNKQLLIRLAIERFGAAKSRSRLSKVALVERLQIFIKNEYAHQAIARLASKKILSKTEWLKARKEEQKEKKKRRLDDEAGKDSEYERLSNRIINKETE